MISKEQLQKLTVHPATFTGWGDDVFAINLEATAEEVANNAHMLITVAEHLAGSCVEGNMIDKEDAMLAAGFLMRAAKAAYASLLGEV